MGDREAYTAIRETIRRIAAPRDESAAMMHVEALPVNVGALGDFDMKPFLSGGLWSEDEGWKFRPYHATSGGMLQQDI